MDNKNRGKESFVIQNTSPLRCRITPKVLLPKMEVPLNSRRARFGYILVSIEPDPVDKDIQLIRLRGTAHKDHVYIFGCFLFVLYVGITGAKNILVPLIVVPIGWILAHLLLGFYWKTSEKEVTRDFKLALSRRILHEL